MAAPPEPAALPTAQQVQENHDALAAIRAEVAASQALVGALEPTEALLAKYAENPGFLAQVPAIVAAYSGVRTVRGDGICFYRAALVALGLSVHGGAAALPPTLIQRVHGAKALLAKHGYSEFCNDFIDALVAYLEGLAAPGSSAEAAAVQPLVAAESEASILYGLRLLTAVELHESADEYEAFIMGAFDSTIADFCQKTVLPSYEECVRGAGATRARRTAR
jgi:hypothetical protein